LVQFSGFRLHNEVVLQIENFPSELLLQELQEGILFSWVFGVGALCPFSISG